MELKISEVMPATQDGDIFILICDFSSMAFHDF